ncbi:MAG: HAD family hydrolase [Verrucomicrobia bacterium]|nr:HAD family hydrolase [Cytophagales bacterium]
MLLILDLDETLIHATEIDLEKKHDFQLFSYQVHKRPHVEAFLQTMNKYFDLAIWSSASDDYVAEVVKNIFPPDICMQFVWGRSRCTRQTLYDSDGLVRYNSSGYIDQEYTKQFKKLRKAGFDLKKVLMVDDTPEKLANSYGNAVYIKPYQGATEDEELLILAEYLVTLKDAENVRILEKRNWREETLKNKKL